MQRRTVDSVADNEKRDEFFDWVKNNIHQNGYKCTQCLSCVFQVRVNFSSQSGLFNTLYVVYKYALTLPCTQVTCERIFSKLKKLMKPERSVLSGNTLNPLLLMYVENDILHLIDKNKIIDEIACSSAELKQILISS